MDANRSMASVLKAIAHPERVRLLRALQGGSECVCHLTALLGHRQPYVSQQLAYLREARLVTEFKDGSRVYYRLRDARVADLIDIAAALAGCSDARNEGSTTKGALDGCACPRCNTSSKTDRVRHRDRKGKLQRMEQQT